MKNNWFEKTAKNANQKHRVIFFLAKGKTATNINLVFFDNFFFFYIRDHISIITLTQKSKFEENCWSKR